MQQNNQQQPPAIQASHHQRQTCSGVLSQATTQTEVLNGIKGLIESNTIVGLFNEVLKNPLAAELVQHSLTTSSDIGAAVDLPWLLFLLSYGAVSDLQFLILAGKISQSSLTPAVMKKLRKSTILETALNQRIVDLKTLQQQCLSVFDESDSNDATSLDAIKELVIELIFDNVLDGKIDEEQELLYVFWASFRGVLPALHWIPRLPSFSTSTHRNSGKNEVEWMVDVLTNWKSRMCATKTTVERIRKKQVVRLLDQERVTAYTDEVHKQRSLAYEELRNKATNKEAETRHIPRKLFKGLGLRLQS